MEQATPIACGETASGDTRGGHSFIASYDCRPDWWESGPEAVYALTLQTSDSVLALLDYDPLGPDLDLFLLTSQDPASCLAYGDRGFVYNMPAPGKYYLVVDGYYGAAGVYTLEVACSAATPTPTPGSNRLRYLPLIFAF